MVRDTRDPKQPRRPQRCPRPCAPPRAARRPAEPLGSSNRSLWRHLPSRSRRLRPAVPRGSAGSSWMVCLSLPRPASRQRPPQSLRGSRDQPVDLPIVSGRRGQMPALPWHRQGLCPRLAEEETEARPAMRKGLCLWHRWIWSSGPGLRPPGPLTVASSPVPPASPRKLGPPPASSEHHPTHTPAPVSAGTAPTWVSHQEHRPWKAWPHCPPRAQRPRTLQWSLRVSLLVCLH